MLWMILNRLSCGFLVELALGLLDEIGGELAGVVSEERLERSGRHLVGDLLVIRPRALVRVLVDLGLGPLDAHEGQDPVDGGAAGERIVSEGIHDLREAEHTLLVVADDVDDPLVREGREEGEGPVIGRGIEGDALDPVGLVLEDVGEVARAGRGGFRPVSTVWQMLSGRFSRVSLARLLT